MDYYAQRESLVKICHTLRGLGWNIYGYHKDESDSMTDYWHPASWDGIAEKNGCVVCVDIGKWRLDYSGREEYEYTEKKPYADTSKIAQIEALRDNAAATEGERQAAQAAIDRILEANAQAEERFEKSKTLVRKWPVFQANPPHCNWHVERDGKILAKGSGAFIFNRLPHGIDPYTGKARDGYFDKPVKFTDDAAKLLAKFKAFIDRLEACATIKIGDADAEPTYETITVTEYRKENKVRRLESGKIEKGARIILNVSFSYGCCKNYVYEITQADGAYIRAKKLDRKLQKVLEGSQRGNDFTCNAAKLEQHISGGAISFCEVVEVKTPYEVEKCVKRKAPQQTQAEQASGSAAFTIAEDTDTRDGSAIFVARLATSLSREEYVETNRLIRTIDGYYSRFKHGFIFRYNPAGKLAELFPATENAEEQAL